MIVDDYAAYPTIVTGGRSGIQKEEGTPSVCFAPRKGPFSALSSTATQSRLECSESRPITRPGINVPGCCPTVEFRDGPALVLFLVRLLRKGHAGRTTGRNELKPKPFAADTIGTSPPRAQHTPDGTSLAVPRITGGSTQWAAGAW
jgi:hypothetical protein